jgi:two-component system, NtrC family, sensor histidine kinase KinB
MSDYTRSSLELLYNISRELTAALDLHTVLTRVLSLSTQSVQAERGSVIVMDEQQKPVDAAIVYEGRLTPHTVDQLKTILDQGLAGWVVRNREAVLVTDTSKEVRWLRRPDDEVDRTGAKSSICVPITMRDELVGVLTMVHATPNSFGRDHLALLQAIADQAGIAIHNARLYESLQAAHKRYHELFEDSIDPILVTNLEGRIQEINRQAVIVSGQSEENLLGISIWDLHNGKPAWLEANIYAVQSGDTVSCETELYPQQHPPIPIEIYVRKISFGGEELLQWIFRDISERKQLDSLRDDLSAMIYHDLRSPLANIVSSLDMLRTLVPESGEDGQATLTSQIVQIAIRSSERMQRLINSLLDINRLEAGQPIANRKQVEVVPLIREALESVQPIIQTKRQVVNIEAESQLPKVWVDEDMIRRVMINLLENAAKFTHMEGALSVGAETKNDWVRIWVKDSGPGIPAEAQDTIFNKFTRIQVERLQGDRLPKGLGLGLAFCRLAVQAHGGRISVESEPGQGSCFYFTVPAVLE